MSLLAAMTVDSLFRPIVERSAFAGKIARFLARLGVTPNFLSVLSLIFAAISGILFAVSSGECGNFNTLLFFAGVFVAANAVFDTLDGVLARETGNATRKGDFLEHVLDRYADVFILLGIIFGGYARWDVGTVAIVGVLLSSYIGVQAQAVGLKRVYGGILGRADILLLILAATVLNAFHTSPLFTNLTALGIAVVIIAIFSHFTAMQRFFYVWRQLHN